MTRAAKRRWTTRAPSIDPALVERLRDAAPLDEQAAARGWEAVRAAHAERAPMEPARRRPRGPIGVVIALAVVALLGAFALSPAGARVSDWVGRAIDPPPSRPAAALPAPGQLLVSGRNGSWIVGHDLRAVPLAEFTEAAFSAKGNYVLLNRGDALFARDAAGKTYWSLERPAIANIAWSGGDGYRVAYRSGHQLRVVAGDGSGDALLDPSSAAVTPAWRPVRAGSHVLADRPPGDASAADVPKDAGTTGAHVLPNAGTTGAHVLAYARPHGQVVLRDVDLPRGTGRTLLRSGPPVEGLAWVWPDRLLVLRGGGLLLIDDRGRVLSRLPRPERGRFEALTASPVTNTAAFVRRYPHSTSDMSVVWSVRYPARKLGGGAATLGGHGSIAFAGAGRIESLALSPNGRWLAFAWPPSDQLVFQRVDGLPKLMTVDDVTRRLGHVGDPAGSAVVGWAR